MTIVRPAALRDLLQLAQSGEGPRSVRTALRRDRRVLVAEQDGCLVGSIILRVVRRGRQTGGGWFGKGVWRTLRPHRVDSDAILQPMRFGVIEDIRVASAIRGQDTDTTLIQHCIQWLEEQGVQEIHMAIGMKDEAACSLLQGLGFEPIQFLARKRLYRVRRG